MQKFTGGAPLLGIAMMALLNGCAGTRTLQMGVLPNNESLVTLTVTEDRNVVARHCQGAVALGPILGCQTSRTMTMPDGQQIKAVKIVRYTDALPSPMAMEIDVHELCHAVASLQPLSDPCHIGNGGMLQAVSPNFSTR